MSVDDAVKGLAILSAIPVAGLALWADYFGRRLTVLDQEDPFFDRGAELFKVRIAGICAIFFQFGIYIGTVEIRKRAPVLANVIFVGAILIQSAIQAGLERKLRSKPKPSLKPVVADPETGNVPINEPGREMELALKAFFWATVGGALYLVGFAMPVIAVSFAAKLLDPSPAVLTSVVVASAVLGMAAGVGINFALGPFYARKMLPARQIAEGKLRSGIESCFERARIPTPSLWVVETGRSREATAMITGFSSGRGVFRPALFLSRGLIDLLTYDEVQAVVLHEVSHLKLQHLRKRLAYTVSLVVGTTATATFCVFVATALAPSSELKSMVGFIAAIAAFAITFGQLGRQSRTHETEADFHSIETLGAGVDDLISALKKLDVANGKASIGATHPPTEMRIAALRARFPAEVRTGDHEQKRAA